jgi:hypothetical protein
MQAKKRYFRTASKTFKQSCNSCVVQKQSIKDDGNDNGDLMVLQLKTFFQLLWNILFHRAKRLNGLMLHS